MDDKHLKALMDLNEQIVRRLKENPNGKNIFDHLMYSFEGVLDKCWGSKEELSKALIQLASVAVRASVIGNRCDNKCLGATSKLVESANIAMNELVAITEEMGLYDDPLLKPEDTTHNSPQA